jgi:hypothetical protein
MLRIIILLVLITLGVLATYQPHEDSWLWDCHTMGNYICGEME